IAAIYGSVIPRLERDKCFVTATCAGCAIHLTRFAFAIPTAAPTRVTSLPAIRLLARSTTLRATARFIRQSSARIKLLLSNGKDELLVAVATIQGLITQSHVFFSILGFIPYNITLYRATSHRQSLLNSNAPYSMS